MSKVNLQLRQKIKLALASESYEEIRDIFELSLTFIPEELTYFHHKIIESCGGNLDASCDEVGNSFLGHAAATGRRETIDLLLAAGASKDHVNSCGNTALSCAIIAKNLRNAEFLLREHGCDPFIADRNHLNALDYLAAIGVSQDGVGQKTIDRIFAFVLKKEGDVADDEVRLQKNLVY